MDVYVTKGSRLRARWLITRPASLAGVQMKMAAIEVAVTGTVRHIRSDDPNTPVNTTFFVDVEEGTGYKDISQPCSKCGHTHVEVNPKHVVEVL